jgi:hypothetical protein
MPLLLLGRRRARAAPSFWCSPSSQVLGTTATKSDERSVISDDAYADADAPGAL